MHWRRVAILAAAIGLMGLRPAQAAPVAFSLSPMTTELRAEAGAEHTAALTVTHEVPPGAKREEILPLRLRVYAADWTLDRKGQPIFQRPGTLPGSCSGWLEINPVDLVVPAGEQRDVRYTLRVPKDVRGTFRTVIMFETLPEPGENGVAINGRIGATIYAQIGPQSKRARISGFGATPERCVVTVENTGTSHVRLTGMLQFRDAAGKLVHQVPMPGGVVLPGENNVREFEIGNPADLASGRYSVTVVIDYGGEVLVGARTHLTIP